MNDWFFTLGLTNNQASFEDPEVGGSGRNPPTQPPHLGRGVTDFKKKPTHNVCRKKPRRVCVEKALRCLCFSDLDGKWPGNDGMQKCKNLKGTVVFRHRGQSASCASMAAGDRYNMTSWTPAGRYVCPKKNGQEKRNIHLSHDLVSGNVKYLWSCCSVSNWKQQMFTKTKITPERNRNQKWQQLRQGQQSTENTVTEPAKKNRIEGWTLNHKIFANNHWILNVN